MGYLVVRKALTLGLQQELVGNFAAVVVAPQFQARVEDIAKFVKEPGVYLRQLVDPFD